MEQPDKKRLFIGRQPILDCKKELYGYELLFRAASDHDCAVFNDQNQASAAVIATALSEFGLHEILGDKLGFINIAASVLHSEMLELLPNRQSVLEILETIRLDDAARERCLTLKAQGFMIALDDHVYSPEHAPFYMLVDIVKVDLMTTDPQELPRIAEELSKYPVLLLAERVETVEQFEKCKKLGFRLFQGYFFERPAVLNQRRIEPSAITMLKLLQQLNTNWQIDEIEETFRENPGLTYSLLKLVNSVMTGLREKIRNIRHAIMILGINHLRRWVQLAIYAGGSENSVNSPLLEMAAVRGRLMELLMICQTGFSRTSEQAEAAFLTGVLSLLDALYETPMENVVENLNISDDVATALLHRKGLLGTLLHLSERLEKADFGAVQAILAKTNISFEQLQAAQLDAFRWRSSIEADGEENEI